MGSRFSGSSILPFNIIIAKWGDDRRIAIPLNTSSKNTLRSPVGPTGEFLLRPENGFPRKKTSRSYFQPPENCDLAWDVLAYHIRALFSNAQRMAMSHETSSPRLLQSRLMPPENGDFALDFLEKQILVPSPATEGGKGHSELKYATFRGSTKRHLVKCLSALFHPAGGRRAPAFLFRR